MKEVLDRDDKHILLNNVEIMEGVIGGIAWILFIFFMKQYFDLHPAIEGGLAWSFVWYSRKIWIRVYKNIYN